MSLQLITNINTIIVLLFCALSAYQYIYIFVSIFFSPPKYEAEAKNRFAVLICARNESAVIAHLIDSIKKQDYPAELLDVFVLADNCHDNTKEVATLAGATVYERYNAKQVGKGYALNELFHRVCAEKGDRYYDGYFVFDADNLLKPDYITQMNRVFSNGYRVVTSYRNSKNFCRNWISAGYGVFFLREARHMNRARMIVHTSCAISGTGFVVHRDIMNQNGGWPYYLLTEDVQFTMDQIARGEKIGYCHDAVFYDEQPIKFWQSWRQRMRWSKGAIQVIFKCGPRVVAGLFRRKSSFSCFDMTMSNLPNIVLSVLGVVSLFSVVCTVFVQEAYGFFHFLAALGVYLLGLYGVNFFLGLVTVLTEWKRIHGPIYKKILYIFTYPIFMIINIPITVISIFAGNTWKEIQHSDAVSIADVEKCES